MLKDSIKYFISFLYALKLIGATNMSEELGIPTLYIDNFRGFEDTYIPLKEVNFFVGENSTGKTSILSLINLLYDYSFWLRPDFNNSEIHLGSFYEIADKKNNKKYFMVGFFNHVIDQKTNQIRYDSVLLKFFNDNGNPSILECSYTYNNQTILSKIAKNNKLIFYKKINNDDIIHSSDSLNIFKQWIQSINLEFERTGFEKIIIKSGFPSTVSVIRTIIENELTGKRKEGELNIAATEANFMGFQTSNPIGNLAWIAPIRAKPERTYDDFSIRVSPEGDHAPYLLKKLLSTAKKSKSKIQPKELIESFGLKSALFNSIRIKPFGKDSSSPFEIDIIINSSSFKIANVGYGISQVLPIIVEVLARSKNTVFAIQQPEVHLHPKAQAALGDFIYYANQNTNKNFFIETHSEYLINRFRLNVHRNNEKKARAQVLFFERTDNGNKVHVIEIEDDGKYSEDQPASFKDFFIKEEIDLLDI